MVSYRRLRSKLRGFESKTKDGERTLTVSVTVALKLISVLILVKKICRIPIIHNIPTISPIFKGSNLSMVSIKETMPIPPSYSIRVYPFQAVSTNPAIKAIQTTTTIQLCTSTSSTNMSSANTINPTISTIQPSQPSSHHNNLFTDFFGISDNGIQLFIERSWFRGCRSDQ